MPPKFLINKKKPKKKSDEEREEREAQETMISTEISDELAIIAEEQAKIEALKQAEEAEQKAKEVKRKAEQKANIEALKQAEEAEQKAKEVKRKAEEAAAAPDVAPKPTKRASFVLSSNSFKKIDKILKELFDSKIEEISDKKLTLKDTVFENRYEGEIFFENRAKLEKWILSDKNSFPKFIATEFSEKVSDAKRNRENTQHEILNHQKFVIDFISDETPYRGLLLYHGLGSGKSAASIRIAEGNIGKDVVVFLPKSLKKNYKDEIKKFGNIGYRTDNHWEKLEINLEDLIKQVYIPKETKENFFNKFREIGIYKESTLFDILKTNKNAIWLIKKGESSNFKDKSDDQKKQIERQCDIIIDEKYKFIHYNHGSYLFTSIVKRFYSNDIRDQILREAELSGLSDSEINKKINRNKILNVIFDGKFGNPFDNKLIIVDEVHNLISMMAGDGSNGTILYEMLMRASNCKLVFLSGTPCINNPFELGLLFNLLRGLIESFTFKLSSNVREQENELKKLIIKTKLVNRININSNTIEVTRIPDNFIGCIDDEDKLIGVKKSDTESISNDKFIETIKNLLKTQSFDVKNVEINNYAIFPHWLKKKNDFE